MPEQTWADFEKAQVALRVIAKHLGGACPSDLHAANLFLFRRAHDYRLEGSNWLRGKTYDGQAHALALSDLGQVKADVLLHALEQFDCLYPIPDPWRINIEQAFKAAHLPALTWYASTDDADYLYPKEQFLHYQGPKLRKRKAQMMQLLAREAIHVLPITSQHRSLVLQTLARWMKQKAKEVGQTDDLPLIEALEDLDRYDFKGLLYCIMDYPLGFVITQSLNPWVEVLRFAKGDDEFPGIYPYMFHDLARRLPQDVRWLNFEQDMGLANFRQAKRSYSPCAMLNKWRLSLAA